MVAAVREVMASWLARELPELVRREYPVKLSGNITAFIGPRRAGKTYFLFQVVEELLGQGYGRKNVAYVDFEDIRLRGLEAGDYNGFVKALHELFQEKGGKIVLLLDEVQNLREWEGWVRTLHNSGRYYIFVTGSSSKLAEREVATQLRGRYVSKVILPYSFREFLGYRKLERVHLGSPEAGGALLKNLRDYMAFGGFPGVVEERDDRSRLELLKTYKETIFYRDVVERFGVRDVSSLESFTALLTENFGRCFSLSKVENYFRSLGVKKSKKTLSNYLKYLEDAFFVFSVPKFGYKTKERVQQPVKVYPVDMGFYNLVPRFSQDVGVLMESLVAIGLFRLGVEFFYWKDYQQNEVDFVINQGIKVVRLVQVTYASGREGIAGREIHTLVKAGKELGCGDLLLITWDYAGTIEQEGMSVKCVPLWKWLLED